ncbi:MAG: hypothetical protein WD556_02645 [Actinomycetota bacterium]
MKMVAGLFTGLLVIATLGACSEEALRDLEEAGENLDREGDVVVMEVTGSGSALVTWGTSGSTSQKTFQLPFRDRVVFDGFDVASVNAQLDGSGKITCRVIVNGAVTEEGNGSGQFATCSATA